jgi:tetratricopeptide (TPR) repeat protein
MVEARRLLERALELDPGATWPWELLAWTHYRDAFNGWSNEPQASWQAFHRAAQKASAVDSMDGGAQVVLGMSHFLKGEVEQGAVAWDRALALSPNDANVLRPVGAQLALALGLERARQGLELTERAMRLDPLHPAIVASAVGFAAYYAGEYEKAIAAFKRKPNLLFDHRMFLAMSYAQLGRAEEAHAEVAEVLRDKPDFAVERYVDDDFFQPGGSSAALFFDGARKAGLPLCASAAEATKLDPKNRLPECEAERAKVATPKT